MTKSMIVDSFIINDELELLDRRLKYYDKYVDRFVLVECNRTFSGMSKPMHYWENRKEFSQFNHKIKYVPYVIDPENYRFDVKLDFIDYNSDHWRLEFEQRNAVAEGFTDLPDDAIIMCSDLDEIMSRETLQNLPHLMEDRDLRRFCYDFLYYNLNTRCVSWVWHYAFASKKERILSETVNKLRLDFNNTPQNEWIFNSGWHLSYFSSPEKIKHKIASFSHQELNRDMYTNMEHINKCIEDGTDLYNRQDHVWETVSLDRYPADMLEIFGNYAKQQRS